MRDAFTDQVGVEITKKWNEWREGLTDWDTKMLVNEFMKDGAEKAGWVINKEAECNTDEASFIIIDQGARTGWWTITICGGYFVYYSADRNEWYAKYL